MKTILSVSMLAAMLAVSIPVSSASADDRDGHEGMGYRERCTMVRKCHREDGRRICEKVRICKDRH